MKGFMQEDLQLALHSDLQPLQSSFPAPELGISAKIVLKACLEQQLQENVKLAQQKGVIPGDEELAELPIFQQARHDDAHHIQRSLEEAAAREEARRLAVEEAKRAEAERQHRAAEEAAAEAERKKEAKEARRQARLVAKKEALKRTRAEEQRRYDELLSRWKSNVEERQGKLDEVKSAISTASEKKAAVQSRLAELTEYKSSLLKQLRDLAAKGTTSGGGGGGNTAADEGAPTTALGAGGSDRDRDTHHRSHLKRPREHQSSSYHHHQSSHHHRDSSTHHSSPPGQYPREGSYECGIDRIDRDRDIRATERDREYPPLGGHHLPPPLPRYGSYSDRGPPLGRDGLYGGDRGGYVRRDVSPGGERGGYHMHHRGGGGGVGERDRGRPPFRDELEPRDRERERERGGYHRDEPRREGGPRPWSGDRR